MAGGRVGNDGALPGRPAGSAVIVLWGAKLDHRKKVYKFFEKADAVYVFNYISGSSPARPHPGRRDAARVETRRGSRELARPRVAPDLFTVVRELEKLAAYADGRELAAREVAEVADASRVESAYDMVRHVAAGKAGEAFAAIDKLLLSGERVESLLGLWRGSSA